MAMPLNKFFDEGHTRDEGCNAPTGNQHPVEAAEVQNPNYAGRRAQPGGDQQRAINDGSHELPPIKDLRIRDALASNK